MQIDYGPGKDATNLSKHGPSLVAAAELSWDESLVWSHDWADNGKNRMVVLALMGDILFFVALAERKPGRRCTSLCRANRRKVNHYARAIKEGQPQDADT